MLKRARDLNYEFDPHKESLTRYLSSYDCNIFANRLTAVYPALEINCRSEIENGNIDNVLREIDTNISNAYREAKMKKAEVIPASADSMNEANTNFESLRKCISGEEIEDFDEVLIRYKVSRSNISKET